MAIIVGVEAIRPLLLDTPGGTEKISRPHNLALAYILLSQVVLDVNHLFQNSTSRSTNERDG